MIDLPVSLKEYQPIVSLFCNNFNYVRFYSEDYGSVNGVIIRNKSKTKRVRVRFPRAFRMRHLSQHKLLNETLRIIAKVEAEMYTNIKQHGCTNFVSDKDNIGLKIIGEKINKYMVEEREKRYAPMKITKDDYPTLYKAQV